MSGPEGDTAEETGDVASERSAGSSGPDRRLDDVRRGLRWLWRTDRTPIAVIREFALSLLVVFVIAMVLFAISGVWPPMVAVESDSMEPQIMTGDLVFIAEPDRFVHHLAVGGTGVVPADRGDDGGHQSFDRSGDVIIFNPNGDDVQTPIIHRAHLWVEADENWFERADPALVSGAQNCEQLNHCPAPHDGFITRGDNNPSYDQVSDRSEPVKAEWIVARAHIRVPWLGHVRLLVSEVFAISLPAGIAWT